MRGTMRAVLVAALALAGCRGASVESAAGPAPGAAPAPESADYLPVGTQMRVELTETLSTDATRSGDEFTAVLQEPIIAQNGAVAVPEGARVRGVVTGLDDSDEVGDQAVIRLDFRSLEFAGRTHPLSAAIVEADVDVDSTRDLEDVAEEAGLGAAAGAVIGAVLGGDLSDAVGGAILGAGAGTIISLGMGDVEAAIPAGSDLVIRTTAGIELR